MSSPVATSIIPQSLPSLPPFKILQTSLHSGRKFVEFLQKNSLHIAGCALATALLINEWVVLGASLAAFSGFNLFSNALASQTWIPRGIRQFVIQKGLCVVGLTTAAALIATQSHLLGVSLLIYSSYKAVDSVGLIPQNLSVFIERYFPWRALPGVAMMNLSTLSILNFSSIITYFWPVKKLIYEKLDLVVHRLFQMHAPTFEEITARYTQPKLTYHDIAKIIQAKDSDYTLDARHCSRSAAHVVPLGKEDRCFDKLLELAKPISWSDHRREIFKHSSFLTFLKEEFPDIKDEDLKKQSYFYAVKLAKAKGLSSGKFAAQWMQNRFENVVCIFNGKLGARVQGSQSKLNEAIADLAKIVTYLEMIDNEGGKSEEIQSILFEIALHCSSKKAGDIRAIAKKMLRKATQSYFENLAMSPLNFAKKYEFKLLNRLEDARLNIIQSLAKKMETTLVSLTDALLPPSENELNARKIAQLPNDQSGSDLFMDLHRSYLSFGFLPIDKYDREDSTIPMHYVAKICHRLFNFSVCKDSEESPFKTYHQKIASELIDCKNADFWNYIQHILDSNNLSAEEQNAIRKLYHTYFFWPDLETQKKFRRLLLVSLGLLKKN